MQFDFKPFLDAIKNVNSFYSVIAFVFIIILATIYIIIRKDNQMLRIIEKKFTKAQGFILYKNIILALLIMAILAILLPFLLELSKVYQQKSIETSVLLYDKPFDVADNKKPISKVTSGYYVSTSPAFSIPLPDMNLWEKPIYISTSEEMIKHVNLVVPKDFDFNDSLFDLFYKAKFLCIFSKSKFSYEIDKESYFVENSPFEKQDKEVYPFSGPIKSVTPQRVVISIVSKNQLESKYKKINVALLATKYMKTLSITPDQLIITRNSAVIIVDTVINNCISGGKRCALNLFRCVRIINTRDNFFIIEGYCYFPELSKTYKEYISKAVIQFAVPEN